MEGKTHNFSKGEWSKKVSVHMSRLQRRFRSKTPEVDRQD